MYLARKYLLSTLFLRFLPEAGLKFEVVIQVNRRTSRLQGKGSTQLSREPEIYRVFSLTWPASMQIYWNKRKRLHKKGVQLPQDWFGTPTWPLFHWFGTPIWPP